MEEDRNQKIAATTKCQSHCPFAYDVCDLEKGHESDHAGQCTKWDHSHEIMLQKKQKELELDLLYSLMVNSSTTKRARLPVPRWMAERMLTWEDVEGKHV